MVYSARSSNVVAVDTALDNMKLEGRASPDAESDTIAVNGKSSSSTPRSAADFKRSRSNTPGLTRRESSHSLLRKSSRSQTPKSEDEGAEETIGGDVTVTAEQGQPPKLSRKKSQKIPSRMAELFDNLEDATEEAKKVFNVIPSCIYASKAMGSSGDHDALDCDCDERFKNGKNYACGEDSDCINRATKMECVDGDCNCGLACQNTRFQHQQYANVSVIKTEKKGYGLRANTDLSPHDFIFEYIGEVIGEQLFRKRTIQYDQEGIKHFYFMSLTKHEFVDATKKGNLGRFCNHSCNPNCYVDKWVVGEKLRMGIFAERPIRAGEELVFNYNVDRYGADPQPCYCGEINCTGFIGGKTQTERATKLSLATIEALGIDDGDGWDTAVAKKPRKKKTGEDDEEYVNNVEPKGLDEEGVRKVMATLMQCKEKWIAVKLLSRIQRCGDERVRNKVVQMHGYQILRTTLTTWKDDNNVILQILDILYRFPRITRNKIVDSKIEATIGELTSSEHEDVKSEAQRLLDVWSKLPLAYRISRRKFDPAAVPAFERRGGERPESDTPKTQSPVPQKFVAPTGPRSNLPQRHTAYSRPPFRPKFNPNPRPIPNTNPNALPPGWFQAVDLATGNVYYYTQNGSTAWQRPTVAAAGAEELPKQPPPEVLKMRALQDIIDGVEKEAKASPKPSSPASSSTPKEKTKLVEKWRSYPQEKQMKLYENTLFPHIKHVMQKFTKLLPKDDLKKFAKEVGKKLVSSDFKNGRVENPTKITEKQEKKVKAYVRAYFEKAVEKKRELDKKKAEKAKLAGNGVNGSAPNGTATSSNGVEKVDDTPNPEAEGEIDFEPEPIDLTPESPDIESSDLKRKREEDLSTPSGSFAVGDESFKRLKSEAGEDPISDLDTVPAPPPPPPPPGEGMGESFAYTDSMEGGEMDAEGINEDAYMANGGIDISGAYEAEAMDISSLGMGMKIETEEDRELKRQEEELMRENEEVEVEVAAGAGGKGAMELEVLGH